MMALAVTSALGLSPHEWWIILIGALAASACGLLGCFLILRRMALMGDAISHAVLPGIVVAVLLGGTLSSWTVFLGAGLLGLLTPALIGALSRTGQVHEDAAMGAIYTVLFAIGVILVSRAGNVDLDANCVLYGEIATAPLDVVLLGDEPATPPSGGRLRLQRPAANLGPRAVWILGGLLLLNAAFSAGLFKELQLASFDEALAGAMGFRPRLLHHLLMGLVALTTIASFEVVGSIIVVAMLIAPGATAYLLTDRLRTMLLISVVVGCASSLTGFLLSVALGGDVSIAGCMSVSAGGLFTLALLLSPAHGLIPRGWRRWRLARRLAREHLQADLYRAHERGQEWCTLAGLISGRDWHEREVRRAGVALERQGWVLWAPDDRLRLTPSGQREAAALIGRHRLWEAYMTELGAPADHVHRSADTMEHFISPDLQAELAARLAHPAKDPHGRPIPDREERHG